MELADVPELGEVLDPGAQLLVPVGEQLSPAIETAELLLFEFVGVPAELLSRLACEEHVVDQLGSESQFGEAARVAQELD